MRVKRTASALNSGVNFLRFLRAMNSSWRIFAPFGLSTEAGEDQIEKGAPRRAHLVMRLRDLVRRAAPHLNEVTERVIREAIDEDVSEAAEAASPKALPGPSGE